MTPDLQQRFGSERRSGKERRSSVRYAFMATCDVTEPRSNTRLSGRTSDLGRGGCYIDTLSPFPMGTVLVIRIRNEHQTLTVEARVAFSQAGLGMGLAFTKVAPDQQEILNQWIAELSGERIARTSSFVDRDASSGNGSAKGAEGQAVHVVHELILMLQRKNVLDEFEGQSLLQKLRE